MPLISIVIPVYNRAQIVGETLASVLGQSCTDFELILVDNNSTDNTGAVLHQWQKKFASKAISCTIAKCLRPGAAAARNEGLALASAPWVLFFDSDDLMGSRHIRHVSDAIKANPEADIIGWDTIHRSENGTTRRGRFYGTDMQWHNLFDGAFATQRWCARTALVRAAGGWNEAVGYWDDIELGARLLATDPKISYIGQADVLVYCHADSITGNADADPARIEPALRAIEKTLGDKGHKWCDLKRAVEYGLCSHAGSTRGAEVASKLTLPHRLTYHYTRLGLRGAARIIRAIGGGRKA